MPSGTPATITPAGTENAVPHENRLSMIHAPYAVLPSSWLPVFFSRLTICAPAALVPAGWVSTSASIRPPTTAVARANSLIIMGSARPAADRRHPHQAGQYVDSSRPRD